MIITLTQREKDTDWKGEYKGQRVLLCPHGMKLLRVRGDMVNLELSLFVQKGAMQVELSRNSPNGIWRWNLPKRPVLMEKMKHEIGSLCFGFAEETIDAILTALGMQKVEDLMACMVWVKFTPVPKCCNFVVKLYTEVTTEVTVFMREDATPQAAANLAMNMAHKLPAHVWQAVPDSLSCDPATDVQKSI